MNLVTGGTGLVGTHLILELLRSGRQVRALKRKQSDLSWIRKVFEFYEPEKGEAFFDRIMWVDADITDYYALEEAFTGIDRVFHAAAIVSFNPRDRKQIMRVNRDGTRNMVNLALENNVRFFCFVSSVAALGSQFRDGGYYVTETEEWKNSGDKPVYAVSKFYAEMEVWRAGEEGLPVAVVNPTVILGPGDWRRGSGTLFRRFSKGIPFYPTGSTGFVDVRDVSGIMMGLAEKNITGERFLLSSENMTFKKVFTLMAGAMGQKPPGVSVSPFMGGIAWRADRMMSALTRKPHEVTRYSIQASQRNVYYETSKIRDVLKYRFIPVKEAIENTADFYKRMIIGAES
ncbi:MAG: NAD-dependent epimerase/dehydratase family protein [Chlorobi bacterium]|nr:NAD-dependent epimerase/dehydratase family protein [Chlorobiota bacterium]